jgi:hypothetical protein
VCSGGNPGWGLGFSFFGVVLSAGGTTMKKQIPFGDDNQRGKGNDRDNAKSNDRDNAKSNAKSNVMAGYYLRPIHRKVCDGWHPVFRGRGEE